MPPPPQPAEVGCSPVPDLQGLSAEYILAGDAALVSTTLPEGTDHYEIWLRVSAHGVDVRWVQGPYGPNETPLVDLPEEAVPGANTTRTVIARVLAYDFDDNEISRVRLPVLLARGDGAAVTEFAPAAAPVEIVDSAGHTVVELNPAGGE